MVFHEQLYIYLYFLPFYKCIIIIITIIICGCVFVCKECDDPVTITPTDDCINTDTTFTCTAPGGHPGTPIYSWTPTGYVTSGQTLFLSSLGIHTFTCDATYRHPQCPQYEATCSDTHTVTYYGQYCKRYAFLFTDNGLGRCYTVVRRK